MMRHDDRAGGRLKLGHLLVAFAGMGAALSPYAAAQQPGTYQHMDYGPVISHSIEAPTPEDNTALKGLAVRLDHDSAMIFDTDLLRFSAATTGGWIDIDETDYVAAKGFEIASTEGELVFTTAPGPGWAHPGTGSFEDTRPDGLGNLPRDHAHYRGHYRHGDDVVLSYTVGNANVLDMPQAVEVEDRVAFVRQMHVSPSRQGHQAVLARRGEGETIETPSRGLALVRGEDRTLAVVLNAEAPEPVELIEGEGGEDVVLNIGDRAAGRPLSLAVAVVELDADVAADEAAAVAEALGGSLEPIDLTALIEGGPAQWEETVEVTGSLGEEDWAYTVDNIALPLQNPWNARMRVMGFDFFPGGERAAITTLNGDVWVVDGIDDSLEQLTWRRFASGMFMPGGLEIVDGVIHVLERSQITRLHDLNGDGEADFYENLNNDHNVYPRAHALTLETDSSGNFYFFKNGNRVPGDVPTHGRLIRVSADGSQRELFAHGFRGNNGLHITDDDLIMTADQQGDWVPTTRVDIVEQGKFYGHRPHGGQDKEIGEYELPVCWIPHGVDNSSGAAALAPDDGRFGPLSGHWLHTSYGKAKLYVLMYEEVDGVKQGGVTPLPLRFESGIMRAQFNDRDGQLYITGMRGWQTESFRDGAFYRVRYTGEPANVPVAVHAHEDGVRLRFTEPLDATAANDLESYTAKRWTYLYTGAYGSPEVSLETPEELRAPSKSQADDVTVGRDDVEISDVTLSDDRREVLLHMPDIHPVMQMMVEYSLKSEAGEAMDNAVYHTIHKLGPAAGE